MRCWRLAVAGSQLVRLTGCRYTGITLSQEQLEYAQHVVKEAHLENKITFQLVDYRNVQGYHKFNRIISCEMLEAVGHEYYAEWFRGCDDLLVKDGLVVVQVISIPEERYDAYRQRSDFIKVYIFPGDCLPSFAALTSAMSSSSSFCVEHMENIGIH